MKFCSQHCRHTVRFEGVKEDGPLILLHTEFCDGGDLGCYAMKQPGGRIQEAQLADFATQLLTGLCDMHRIGVLHRDIKPDNLLLTCDKHLHIGDFGWAAEERDELTALAGTFQYMAPEVLEARIPHTWAVDVWSAGATLVELLSGACLLPVPLETGQCSCPIRWPALPRLQFFGTSGFSYVIFCPLPSRLSRQGHRGERLRLPPHIFRQRPTRRWMRAPRLSIIRLSPSSPRPFLHHENCRGSHL